MSETPVINHHTALIYVMVLVSASDGEMTDAELSQIGNIVTHLPVFEDFDLELLAGVAASCTDLLQDEAGLDTTLGLVNQGFPEKLPETASAIACGVAVSDHEI